MIKSRRPFTLLEVLIAILLILSTLPLLLTPFVYASADQMETIEKIKQQKAALYLVTMLFTDLHTGAIPLTQIDQEVEYPFKNEWKIEGTYQFKKIKSSKNEQDEAWIELWQVIFVFKNQKQAPFIYEFVIGKKS